MIGDPPLTFAPCSPRRKEYLARADMKSAEMKSPTTNYRVSSVSLDRGGAALPGNFAPPAGKF